MSSAWSSRRLGDIVLEMGDGGTPDTNKKEYFGGDIPWVVIQDIKPEISSTQTTLTREGLLSSSAKLWPVGAVILSTGATIGEVGIAKVPLATKQGITGIVCRPALENKFLYYKLQSLRDYLRANSQGSTIREVRVPFLSQIIIDLPDDKDEQAQIAEILSMIDRAIEQTEAIIEKQRRIKNGLVQDLLTKGIDKHGNIRSKETHEFKDSPLGRIPADWEYKTAEQLLKEGILGEIQDGNHGELHPKSKDFVEEGVPFIMAADIVKGTIDFDGCKKITEKKYRSLRIGFAKSKDVLLSHKASVGFVAIVPDNAEQLMLTPQVTYYRIKNTEKLLNVYLYYYIQSRQFQNSIKNLAKQSTRDYIGILAQHNLLHLYPKELSEQQRIIDSLQAVDKVIGNGTNELSKLKRLKLGLMQDLLTGKVPTIELLTEKREVRQVS